MPWIGKACMRFCFRFLGIVCFLVIARIHSAWGELSRNQDFKSDTLELGTKIVQNRRSITPSNSQVVRDRDLALRVMTDPADIVKVTPGLFTGQHAGGGKANQYFIRGFDADHGTDLSLWFDDIPVNMVSHGHGQGYADLHFVIPELVDRVEVDKGPYNIEYGDLNTAGAVRMQSRSLLTKNQVQVSGGMFGTTRILNMLTLDAPLKPLMAAEVYRSDGPFKNPENLERYNLFIKTPIIETPNTSLNLTLMGYGSGWNGSGQIPLREVQAGRISRWGSIDPSEGGHSQRHSASMAYLSIPNDKEEWKASAYVINYRLSLFSNFTFFAQDIVNGDEINQRDDRLVSGLNATYRRNHDWAGRSTTSLIGISTRNDNIHNNLDNALKRKVISKRVDAIVNEGSLSAFFQESISPLPWLYLEAGVRGDHFGFDVVDQLHQTGDSSLTGVKDASIFSPKFNAVITPIHGTDLYFNYGEGFHSNDARGVTNPENPARPLTKAQGYEVGVRTRLWNRWDLASSLWILNMEGEFVWSGDGGETEESIPSQRKGVDFETRYEILPWLWADLDLTACSALYTQNAGNGNAVALAPRLTMAGGLSMQHPSGIYGSFRGQHLDDRPADEGNNFVAEGSTIFDMALGYRYGQWETYVNMLNVFNSKWRNAQFENDSRLPSETVAVTDMHFVPGMPFNLQGGVKLHF
jgi:outer membrane receptor protein involved in Fe transport